VSIKTKPKGMSLTHWTNAAGVRPDGRKVAPEQTQFLDYHGIAFLRGETVDAEATRGMRRVECPWLAAEVWVLV
jgi:hypothetical protein